MVHALLLLLLAPVATASPEVEAPIAVQMMSDAEPGREPLPELDAVLAALRLRAAGRFPDIRPWSEEAGPCWLVQIEPQPPRRIAVRIFAPDGAPLLDSQLAAGRRAPRVMAHTIALLVVEVLAAVQAEAGGDPLPAPEPEPVAAEVSVAAPAAPPEPAALWIVGIGGGGELLLPKRQTAPGVDALAKLAWRGLQADASVGWRGALVASGSDFRLRVEQTLLRLRAGPHLRAEHLYLAAQAGPAARLLSARLRPQSGASTEELLPERTFKRQSFVAWGLSAGLQGGVLWRGWLAGFSIDATRYAEHPIFARHGESVLNTGHTAVGAALIVGASL